MSTVSTRIVISAKDTASGVFRKTAMQVENLKNRVFSLNSAVAGLGLGLGGMEIYTQARDFETVLTDMAKVSNRELGLIRSDIMSLPPELGNATELMRGYYQVMSAGVTEPQKALDVLTVSAKAAKAAHTSQEEVVKALTKTMAGYAGEIENATQASDLLFSIEKVGQTNFAELVPVMGDLATLSHSLGVNTNELGGSLAMLTQTAGTTAQAGTQYKALLMGLYKPTEKMEKLLNRLDYDSGKALVDEKGLVGALRTVELQSEKSGVALGDLFESSEALIALNALFSNSFKTLEKNIAAVEQGTGGTNAAWEDWLTTAQAIEDALKNELGTTLADLGTELLPTVKDGMKDFTGWVGNNKTEINGWAQDIGTVMTSTGTAVSGLLDVFHGLPDWMKESSGMGLIGGMLFGPKGAAVVTLLATTVDAADKFSKGHDAYKNGTISFGEWASSDDKELEALLADRNSVQGQIQQLEVERDKYLKFSQSSYYANDQALLQGKIKELTSKIDDLKLKMEAQRLELASRQFENKTAPASSKSPTTAGKGDNSPKGTKSDPLTVSLSDADAFWSKVGIDQNSAYAYDLNHMDSVYADHDKAMDRAFEQAAKRQAKAVAKAHKEAAKDAEKAWKESSSSMVQAGESVASTIGDAMGEMALGTEVSFENMASSIIRSLMRIYVTQPLTEGLGGMMGNMFGNMMYSDAYSAANYNSSYFAATATPHAKGGVIAGGNISAYSGTVVDTPTFFSGTPINAYANGGNLMGEAGPEAILPLSRNPQGKLGVEVYGLFSQQNAAYERIRNAPPAAPQINVHVTNEDGVKSEVTNEESFFDGERWVCDMWLKGYKNNTNGMRDSLGRR